MQQKILNLWNKLPDNWKIKIISAFNTFSSIFILTVATSLVSEGGIAWTVAFWGGILSIAVREAFKAVVNTFVSKKLGGRK